MDTQKTNLSVLMLPWLAHGHISPFLELSKLLAKRNFHVYLCSTPINLSSIKQRITQEYSLSIETVELHLPSSPELPPHFHTTNGLPTHLNSTLIKAFEMASPAISNIFDTLKPDLLIYDFNQPWAAAIASSHSIPAVYFLTTGAAVTSFGLHFTKKAGENFPFPKIYFREPRTTTKPEVVDSSVNDVKLQDLFAESLKRSNKIVLIKSFREIEGNYIDYLPVLTGKKIVPVGPLVPDPVNQDEHKEIMQWLDKKEEASTVFVSFGSEYFLSKEVMEEVAHGLELSKVNFIWVVRFPMGEKTMVKDALPEGFLDRVGDIGLIVERWAPQANILGHSSTGGFVSHCGWGSTMESMYFGVPIIALPMLVDQPFNAQLVEEVGVGLEVERGKNGKIQREEISKVIRKIVVDRSGEGIRRKARELKEKVRMKEEEDIDEVVEELLQLCRERNISGM
ncbi:unnamed protein product [Ilex paraguariensis]|uniref:Glycosyltransferase n=1 Tax=Ilex paraguariensis TaxID=185542 RepID=A0ABC8R830_9AQUA